MQTFEKLSLRLIVKYPVVTILLIVIISSFMFYIVNNIYVDGYFEAEVSEDEKNHLINNDQARIYIKLDNDEVVEVGTKIILVNKTGQEFTISSKVVDVGAKDSLGYFSIAFEINEEDKEKLEKAIGDHSLSVNIVSSKITVLKRLTQN